MDKVWTFTQYATTEDKAFLKAELDAVTGGVGLKAITIPKAEDFAFGQ